MRAIALLLTFVAATGLCAQEQTGKAIDRIFQEWNKPDTPGVGVAVIQKGKIVFEKGYGIANLEYGVPIGPGTVFHVASVSKQFTAMALVLLEQDGKLSIDDDVRKYLPELPDYGQKIAIRNLLQHTSGVRDQWQTLAIAGWRLDDVITQKQILRMLFRQKELNFPPGTEHLYSNGGYTLAAEIVARVSGKSMPEFCAERIFKPQGMTHTHFHIDHQMIVPNRAYSYSKTKDGFQASPLNYANVGATSLFTTAGDLARWLDNFREPKVGGRKAIERLTEQAVLTTGKKIDYALGVSVSQYRGLATISHSGGDAGYRSHVMWFPEEELGIAVVSNLGSCNPGLLATRVAEVYAGAKMTAEPVKTQAKPAERKFVEVDAKTLDQYAGIYRLNAELTVEIEQKNGKLMAGPLGMPKAELRPLASNRFYSAERNLDLEFMRQGEAGMLVKLVGQGGQVDGERITTVRFDAADLPAYPGMYFSEELETQYTIKPGKNGGLIADHAHHGEIALRPLGKDWFASSSWFLGEVRFERDSGGHVTGIRVGNNRTRSIYFSKRTMGLQ